MVKDMLIQDRVLAISVAHVLVDAHWKNIKGAAIYPFWAALDTVSHIVKGRPLQYTSEYTQPLKFEEAKELMIGLGFEEEEVKSD